MHSKKSKQLGQQCSTSPLDFKYIIKIKINNEITNNVQTQIRLFKRKRKQIQITDS